MITLAGIEQLPALADWSSKVSCLKTSSTLATKKEKGVLILSLLVSLISRKWLFR